MRVAVVSHALIAADARARWQVLARDYPVEVTLLVPERWTSAWLGRDREWRAEPVQEGRFAVRPLKVSEPTDCSRYAFCSIDAHLRSLQPGVICVMQDESTRVLQQMILYRRVWARDARLVFFTWNNIAISTSTIAARWFWRNARRGTDACIAGNSEAVSVLRAAGYEKPILNGTEIGVDETRFAPNPVEAARFRQRHGLAGRVVGFAGRLVEEKGIFDLARALLGITGDWTLLVAGGGPGSRELEDMFRACGESSRLRLLGELSSSDMPGFFRALDALVLPSRGTPTWREQFGLVLAQAMACGIPVIGSTSGAIPEVIGEGGLLFPEADVPGLRQQLERVLGDSELRLQLGERGRARALAKYGSAALAADAYGWFQASVQGRV